MTHEQGLKRLKAWLRKKAPPDEQLHKSLFILACFCRDAGLTLEQAALMCRAYCSGATGRHAPEREINAAVESAYNQTYSAGPSLPKAMPELMAECDIYPVSVPYPVFPDEPPEFFLAKMFPGDPWLCVGATAFALDCRPLEEWVGMLGSMQFLVPSAMLSETGRRKSDGAESFHAESNTGPRQYLVTEFDGAGKPAQMARIRSLTALNSLPLVCIVDSTGKSLHAWWKAHPDEDVNLAFFSRACQLGADPRLWLKSQFARLPAGTREGKRQEVLFFNL